MAIGPEQENTDLYYIEAGSVRSGKSVSRYVLQSIIGPSDAYLESYPGKWLGA